MDIEIRSTVETLLEALEERNFTIAVAESCTGGMLGGSITSVPGSSTAFLGGVIAYHNRIKREHLNVTKSMLEEHGAVSEPVARRMAAGVADRFGSDVAISITGIAGPSGGSPKKSVGLVFIGYDGPETTEVVRIQCEGDRADVRARSVQSSLEFALARIMSHDNT